MESLHEIFPLPQDVVTEIFLRLPFDSILDCKLVSKQWKNFINSPKFYNLYRTKSLAIVPYRSNLYCLRQNKYKPPSDAVNHPFTVHRIPISFSDDHQLLSGSMSSRIVCVKAPNGHFLFYNLFTGASGAVKDAPFLGNPNLVLGFGFGYDRYADDYKIVVVNRPPYGAIHNWPYFYLGKRLLDPKSTEASSKNNGLIWVYSFRNRRWEPSVGFFRGRYAWPRTRERAYYFNGILHWVVIDKIRVLPEFLVGQVISTYDLHSGRFGEMALPKGGETVDVSPIKYAILAEHDGQLRCCVADGTMYDSYNSVQVWVMKEYGVGESWTKLITIDLVPGVQHAMTYHRYVEMIENWLVRRLST